MTEPKPLNRKSAVYMVGEKGICRRDKDIKSAMEWLKYNISVNKLSHLECIELYMKIDEAFEDVLGDNE